MTPDDGAAAPRIGPLGAPLTPQEAHRVLSALSASISRALRGKQDVVELALAALAAGGHLLLEDVPGVGKTTLAQALARSLDLAFARIQFTSDLLPGDITGVSVYDQARNSFVFKPGPLFANLVLADEINRTTPRTQSCLLEAMAEGQVSVDGAGRPLPAPFMVLATQNPHEHAGTYPLPESQLDRFLLRLSVGYPPAEVARALLRGRGYVEPDDVKELCVPALAHRIVLAGRGPGGGELERLAVERVVRDLVEQVPVPE